MNIIADVIITCKKEELQKLFLSELKSIQNDRAFFEIKNNKSKNTLCLQINAKDSTSFRAITNSISKLLTIYEKTDEVIQNEN